MFGRKIALVAAFVVALASFTAAHADFSKRTYNDVTFPMNDHVDILGDVYLPPTGNGPFPCLVEMTPYRKELRASEGSGFLPGQGFVLIEVDARGTGGSQGEYDVVFSKREQLDAKAIVDMAPDLKLDGQTVCKDKVGMYGGSYSGIIQYLVASIPDNWGGPPTHLAAIAPQRAYGDLYRDIVYQGGMIIGSFGEVWSAGTTGYYTAPPTSIPTAQGQTAWSDHLTKNDPMMLHYLNAPAIDANFTPNATAGDMQQKLYLDSSILPRIQNLKVPTLHLAGWFDAFTRGQVLTIEEALKHETPGAPNYAIIGPWNHSNTHFIAPAAPNSTHDGLKEMLAAWYHHWLDGDPAPAFMSGPRIKYWEMGTGALLDTTGGWHGADEWPLPGTQYTRYYLRGNGGLSTLAAPTGEAPDSYVYNPAAGTAELLSRYDNAASGSVPMPAWDQRTDEPKGLSFSTGTLTDPLHVDGPINLHLVASTTALAAGDAGAPTQLTPDYLDTDFIVKVSDVAEDGTATLITEGYLRASHRALDPAGTEYSGSEVIRAQHLDTAGSIQPVDDGQTGYDIEVWPTAKTFAKGHQLRLDLYAADTPNHLTLLKPVINSIFHQPDAQSYLLLPLQ